MKTISTAVIGVGAMGKNHARVYSELENVELVAVSDTDRSNSKKVAEKYKCSYYSDHNKMLKKEDVDAVSIVVPTNLHTKVGMDCIKNNVNLLIEKPIADNVENGRKMIDAAKKERLVLTVGHVERFNPAVIELKKRLLCGELGRIFKVSVHRVGPFPKRIRDVGVVIDLATHDLDIMRYLVSSEVTRVYAESERKIHTTHEDLLDAVIKFENNVVGILDINWLTPEKIRELSIVGEKGMFVVKYLSQELFFYENAEAKIRDYDYSDILMGVTEGNVLDIRIKKTEPLKAELSSFVDCVRGGGDPLVSGEDALSALRLALCLIESSMENKVVYV
ncbi:MAG: Gfo/Idh/MocA family oxidoreductase [Methanobacteriota archaeon]